MEDDDGNVDIETSFVPYLCMNCGFNFMDLEIMDDIKDLPKIKDLKKVTK
jgi:hypothetical protein